MISRGWHDDASTCPSGQRYEKISRQKKKNKYKEDAIHGYPCIYAYQTAVTDKTS